MENNILIHDTKEFYSKLIFNRFPNSLYLYYTKSMLNFDNIDFDKFSLIIIFINNDSDLLDLVYLNKLPNVKLLVGISSRVYYNKLLYFNNIDVIDLNMLKNDLLNKITEHINNNFYKDNISSHSFSKVS